jgi:hypothetical protein
MLIYKSFRPTKRRSKPEKSVGVCTKYRHKYACQSICEDVNAPNSLSIPGGSLPWFVVRNNIVACCKALRQ